MLLSRGKMTEQRVEICLNDDNGHEIGILTLKPESYFADLCPRFLWKG